MTVQELINELEKIQDKSKTIGILDLDNEDKLKLYDICSINSAISKYIDNTYKFDYYIE